MQRRIAAVAAVAALVIGAGCSGSDEDTVPDTVPTSSVDGPTAILGPATVDVERARAVPRSESGEPSATDTAGPPGSRG